MQEVKITVTKDSSTGEWLTIVICSDGERIVARSEHEHHARRLARALRAQAHEL